MKKIFLIAAIFFAFAALANAQFGVIVGGGGGTASPDTLYTPDGEALTNGDTIPIPDSTDYVTPYQLDTAKENLRTEMLQVPTIFNSDGALDGPRELDADGNSLTVENLSAVSLKYESTGVTAIGADATSAQIQSPSGAGRMVTDNDGATAIGTSFDVSNGANDAGEMRLMEDADNGTNYMGLKAAPSIATSFTLTGPNAAPASNGQVMAFQTSGAGAWATVPTGSGASGRVSFWSGTNTLSSSANFLWVSNQLGISGSQYIIWPGTGTTEGLGVICDNFSGNTVRNPIVTSTRNALDVGGVGLGTGISFRLEDNASTEYNVGDIAVNWASFAGGGNGRTDMKFRTWSGSGFDERLILRSAGTVNLPAYTGAMTGTFATYAFMESDGDIIQSATMPLIVDKTITAGATTGDQTINKYSGSVNFAAAATTLTVTNSLVTVNSNIQCTIATNDLTLTTCNCVAGTGSFVINAPAATAETRINFVIFN